MNWHLKTLTSLNKDIRNKKISVSELTLYFLERIKNFSWLNAVVDFNEELSLAQAEKIEQQLSKNKNCFLSGVPILHKDIFVTKGWNSTAASKILQKYKSPFDAHIVELLGPFKSGMICLGKTNMDEFGMGSTNENSFFGPVKNPWNSKKVSGGSSGGSAAAVAAGLIPAATGSDTGGSIRQPCAFCGVTGIKPTYGLISRYGMISYASSLEQAGPIAKTAEDCAWMLSKMVGHDPRDSTSLNRPTEDYESILFNRFQKEKTVSQPLSGLKIGIPREYFGMNLASEIKLAIKKTLQVYESLGANLFDITLPSTELSVPVYYVIASAEASSNLSKFDGIRYGYRTNEYKDLIDMYSRTRSEGFGMEVKRRIMLGTYMLSSKNYSTFYLKAQKIRKIIADDFKKAFQICDLIMTPISKITIPDIDLKKECNSIEQYLEDIYTVPANLTGLPAMSHPCGIDDNQMPIGIQIIGNYFDESRMLYATHIFQQVTAWHTKMPQNLG